MVLQLEKRHIVVCLISVVFLAILAYSNTFDGDFQFDDDASIVENPYVNGISRFQLSDFISGIGSGVRPVTTLTFSLNYQFSRLDVIGYHITNLIIHILNGILVFYLVFVTMRSPALSAGHSGRAVLVALISSAIFLLHPVQTEAVSYISQRYESLSSLFYLCSLIFYIKARLETTGNRPHTIDHRLKVEGKQKGRFKSVVFGLLSIVSGILALGSKEIAVTLPVIILLYDFYFLEDRPFLKRIAVPGAFIAASIIACIFIVMGFSKGTDAGFSVKAFTPWEYLLTQFRVVTTYIRLLFLPVNQNIDYDVRVSRSFFEVDVLLSFVFLFALAAAAVLLFKRWRVGSFFILWFFIILAPTSSIIPIKDLIFEHRVYLAAAGIFIAVSDIFVRWVSAQKGSMMRGWASVFVVAVLMILLAVVTFQRNKVWETKLFLWEDAVKKSPMKSRTHNNLGNCYMLLGRHFEAIGEYKKAIALDKNNIEAYYNLALNLDNVGLLSHAVYYYDIFYRIAPDQYNGQRKIARERIQSFTGGKVLQ